MSWKMESARHSLARKGIETGRKKDKKIKQKRGKVEVLEGKLKDIYPIAYKFIHDEMLTNENQKKFIEKINIRFMPRTERPKDWGKQPDVDAESFPEKGVIRIWTFNPKWAKIDPKNSYQNKIIIHELYHMLKPSKITKKYVKETKSQWEKESSEQRAIHLENIFERMHGKRGDST